MQNDYQIWDARNGNVQGPYTQADAEKLADDLNHMVVRNTMPFLYTKDMKVTGPFYPRKIVE